VINIDDAKGLELVQRLQHSSLKLWTVSMEGTADIYARHVRTTAQGMCFDVCEAAQSVSLTTAALGDFNVMNLLGVIAALRQAGHALADAVAACHDLQAVPGRMQQLGHDGTPAVVVDYAHTPDAVAKALQALRPWAHARGGRLHCVLGCGGDRDSSKRAPMARCAEDYADVVCLTSDNPRSEDPQHILQQMLQGMREPQSAVQQLDRGLAIAERISQADVKDVVLIAGKGHETYQEIKGQKLPFSDADHALLALQSWGQS
jgi:UDP-N-acetylmuramyl-tripeptide synthetase